MPSTAHDLPAGHSLSEPHDADTSDEAYTDPYDIWDADADPSTDDARTASEAVGTNDVPDTDPGGETRPTLVTTTTLAGAAVAATVAVLALNLLLTGGLSYFFDLSFVVVCLLIGMAAGDRDLFTAGVLPPLLYGAAVLTVTVVAPQSFVLADDGFVHVLLTGLVTHVGALGLGYATTLLVVAARGASRRLAI